jgi:adenylosuccinate lyase
MRAVWSETTKRRIWRRIWFAVAQAQAAAGLVTPQQVDEIQAHLSKVDVERSLALEAEIGHDLVAELMAFAEQCPTAGGVLHWGLTSADVQDNADIIRQKAALTLLLEKLRLLLLNLARRIEATADIPVLGYTHLQPAEPTTLGYRFSGYAQDLVDHFEALNRVRLNLRGKGIKGAVGTAAPFVEMLVDTPVAAEMLEATVMEALDMQAFPITTQTYPRVQDYTLLSTMAGLAASLHKFAFDLRMMQSPGFRAAAEPFGERQVGSSSMPFKRNPIRAEKICSLARHLIAAAEIAWQNTSAHLLERTLDDSANRRSVIPESFLALDEMLITADEIVQGMVIDRKSSASWLETYGAFAATERLLTALVKAGADRQEMHGRLREHSLQAWEALQQGKPNPLRPRLTSDTAMLRFLRPEQITELLKADGYLGLAPQRARGMAKQIKDTYATPADQEKQ